MHETYVKKNALNGWQKWSEKMFDSYVMKKCLEWMAEISGENVLKLYNEEMPWMDGRNGVT